MFRLKCNMYKSFIYLLLLGSFGHSSVNADATSAFGNLSTLHISNNNRTSALPLLCGSSPSFRITGGNDTEPQKWPWMVSLRKNFEPAFCGASLISDIHILTAAHCLDELKYENKIQIQTLRVGISIYQRSGGYNSLLGVKEFYVHPKYGRKSRFFADLAVLVLERKPVSFASPICLPGRYGIGIDLMQVDNPLRATVLGWGRLKEYGRPSESLQKVDINILAQSSCNKAYRAKFHQNSMLCGGMLRGGKDSCTGDSGGPLMIEEKSGRWHQMGIVSFGNGCGQKGYPGVYTDVSAYAPWIYDMIFQTKV